MKKNIQIVDIHQKQAAKKHIIFSFHPLKLVDTMKNIGI